jgi:hypothetical protein
MAGQNSRAAELIRPYCTDIGNEIASTNTKQIKKNSGPKNAYQCLESISDMFAFDWTLKDIANLKNNPRKSI